jgi:DNA-directed RNA polymerase specialized sigma24 family protein
MSPIRTKLEVPHSDRGGLLEAVRSVLARLPAEQREVVILLGYYRLTRDEISALLGQPAARINAHFRAAVRNLRALLGPSQSLQGLNLSMS